MDEREIEPMTVSGIDNLEDMRAVAYTLAILADNILSYTTQLEYKVMLSYMDRLQLEEVINEKEALLAKSSNYEKIKRKVICLLRKGVSP